MTSFTTTKQAHPDCTGCAEMAKSAEGIARATGSVGGSYGDGTHSATVERVATEGPSKQRLYYDANEARVAADEAIEATDQEIQILEERLEALRRVRAENVAVADELAEAEKVAWAVLKASGEYVPPLSDY